jgi:hypothetical protein
MSKAKKCLLWASGILTGAICLVMNFIFIPQIESSTGGIRCFDMNFGYKYDDAVLFLSRLSDESRAVYLTRQLPLDFVYPLVYCVFFSLLISVLLKKKNALLALPVVLAVCDYCENICSLIMLRSTELSRTLVTFASAVTAVKTVLMYIVFLIIIVLLIKRLAERRKEKG